MERWGQLDLLSVVDVINGRDLRAGFLTPPQHLRLPAAMARLQASNTIGQVELTWLPLPVRDAGSVVGTDWSLIRQNWLSDLATEASSWPGDALTEAYAQESAATLAQALSEVDPWTRAGISQLTTVSDLPAATGIGSDLFLRIEASGGGIDGALMGGWMTTRQSGLSINEDLLAPIQQEHLPGTADAETISAALSAPITQSTPQTAIAGAEAFTLLGPVGVRLEGLWTGKATVSRQWFQTATSPTIATGAGLDWSRGTLVLSGEASWRRLLDPPSDPWLTTADQVQVAGAAVVRTFSERATIQLGGVYDLSFSEHLLRGTFAWRASDAIELTGGFLVVGGSETAPASLVEAAGYTGGPLGYWGDNDCLTVELAFIQ